jgi:hypothetical protein
MRFIALLFFACALLACTKEKVEPRVEPSDRRIDEPARSEDPTPTPAPAPAPEPPVVGLPPEDSELFRTRVFCETQPLYSPFLTTLLTSASQRFLSTDIAILDEQGRSVDILNHFPLWSDGASAEVLVVARDLAPANRRKLLLAAIDLPDRKGKTTQLATFPSLPHLTTGFLPTWDERTDWIALDDTRSLVVLPDEEGKAYRLLDLRTTTELGTLAISPQTWFNPELSGGGQYMSAQTSQDGVIKLGLWDLEGKQALALPAAKRGSHQVAARFFGNRLLAWLEWTPQESSLWIYNLSTREATKLRTFQEEVSPLLAAGYGMGLHLAVLSEHLEGVPQKDAVALPSKKLVSGRLTLITLSMDDLRMKNEEVHPFPAEWTGIEVRSQPRFLMSLDWSPWSQQFIMTKAYLGGLVRFDDRKGIFANFGYPDYIARCLYPRLTPEYVEMY